MARQNARSPRAIDAEKSLTHRAILVQSPLWVAAVGWVMLTGRLAHWGDAELLFFSGAVSAPALLVPAHLEARRRRGGAVADHRDITDSYWFRLNAWVFVVVCWGTYFGTHYFFDLMGMRYNFSNIGWTLDAQVLGSASGQTVPLFMYPLTHAYFMTYFVVMLVAERSLADVFLGPAGSGSTIGRACIVLALSYVVAFLETFFMAAEVLQEYFSYADRGRMMKLGSLGYAMYFIAGLPMARRIDGGNAGQREKTWNLERTVIEAAATCMMIQVLLEIWAKVAGPL